MCGGVATWLLRLLFLVVFAEVGLADVVVVVVDVVIVCGRVVLGVVGLGNGEDGHW